jgi:hypothetical protein
MAVGKPTFLQAKTYNSQVFVWSPGSDNKKVNPKNENKRPYFCNATYRSQGQDWVTSWTYDLLVVNYIQERSAYVECGYAE